jgi:hypothetical protein
MEYNPSRRYQTFVGESDKTFSREEKSLWSITDIRDGDGNNDAAVWTLA